MNVHGVLRQQSRATWLCYCRGSMNFMYLGEGMARGYPFGGQETHPWVFSTMRTVVRGRLLGSCWVRKRRGGMARGAGSTAPLPWGTCRKVESSELSLESSESGSWAELGLWRLWVEKMKARWYESQTGVPINTSLCPQCWATPPGKRGCYTCTYWLLSPPQFC